MSEILDYWQAFPNDYVDSRNRFIAQAKASGAALAHYAHPSLKGPDGTALSVDVAQLGPADASRTLLVLSGTHGLEGAAGSAAQLSWLAAHGAEPLPPDVNVVLVHALNPYGYAFDTRTNESNVDLNRNFIDHDQPHPANPAYDALHPHLIPAQWSAAAQAGVQAAITAFSDEHGADALFNATASGQYTQPRGLVYGGVQREWSNLILERVLAEHLAASQRVAFIDWHTGIGEYADAFFLCFNADGSPEQQQAAAWWGADRVLAQRPHGLARPAYQGLVFEGVRRFLPGRQVAGAVVEFGTRGLHMREALRLDQWLRWHAQDAPDAARDVQLRIDLIDAFVPVSGVWRRAVVQHGIDITAQALRGLANWR